MYKKNDNLYFGIIMVQVVILAAGRGKRMGEYTEDCTKAMLPLPHNISDHNNIDYIPMAAVTVNYCKQLGLTDFIFVVGYRKEDVIEYFGDGSNRGINVQYVEQKNICGGTANAVEITKDLIKKDNFILIYGDVVPSKEDLSKLLNFAKKNTNVMGVKIVKDPSRYGVIEVNNISGNITRIVEKSENPPSNCANSGVYVLPFTIFKYIEKTEKSSRGEYELTDSIQYFIDNGGIMKTFSVNDLKDIGTKEEYIKVTSNY